MTQVGRSKLQARYLSGDTITVMLRPKILIVSGLVLMGVMMQVTGQILQKSSQQQAFTAVVTLEKALNWRTTIGERASIFASPDGARARKYIDLNRFTDNEGVTWQHLIQIDALHNEQILDANNPQMLLYRIEDGKYELNAYVYILPAKFSFTNTPPFAGGRGVWHVHDNMCIVGDPEIDVRNLTGVGLRSDGQPCARGIPIPKRLMLHVWIVPNSCGPFADSSGKFGGVTAQGDHTPCDLTLAQQTWPNTFFTTGGS